MNILERLILERGGSLPGHVHVQAYPQGIPAPAPALPNPSLQRILELTGQTLESLRSQAAEIPQGQDVEEVPDTAEFRRIRDLPRRGLDGGAEWAARLTAGLSTPWGSMALRPLQALALHDIRAFGGLLGPIRVGAGKTLISYLAPTVAESSRPLLIVPAKLKAKTRREFRALAKHWMGPDPDGYRIETYELLGRPQAGDKLDERGQVTQPGLLERYLPDLIVLDEAHKAKSRSAAVTRRLRRYIESNPGCRVVAMSGTIINRSIREFAHISEWCLPRACPTPTTHGDLEAWCGALDEKLQQGQRRVRPGALRQLLPPGPGPQDYGGPDELSAVRQAFRARMVETPGVVATSDGPLACSLSIEALDPKALDPQVDAAFQVLRSTYTTPAGIPITDGITFKRHALEIALGFEYVWDPQPPEEWLTIRRAWAKFCREVIKHNRRSIDSEAQVVNAVDRGLYPDHGLLGEWRRIRDTFIPNTIPVWFSSEALETAAEWLEHNPHGIAWTDHVAFAEALAKLTRLPYYGREGKDWSTPAREYIEDHQGPHGKGGPIIASIRSNAEGRNLQTKWWANLVVAPPSSGKAWEQLLGRTHRDGQPADEVTAEVYLACSEHAGDFYQAQRDAQNQQDMTGQAQKLRYSDMTFPELGDLAGRSGARWGGSGGLGSDGLSVDFP